MGDSYREILIKRETTGADTAKKFGLTGVIVLMAVVGVLFWFPLLLVGIILEILAWVFLFPKFDVEYEYMYVNGSLDIDAIYAKQKRKKMCGYELEEIELVALENSHALDSYRNGNTVKDYSSGREDTQKYVIVYNKDGKQDLIKVELDEGIVSDLRRRAPRKVNLS